MDHLNLLGFGQSGWGWVLLIATFMTVAVSVAALLIGAVIGAIITSAKLSGVWLLALVGDLYTTVFRGVPELLVIYLIYFGGSSALTSAGRYLGYNGFLSLPPFAAGALAVGIISGSYQAEVFRGAVNTISKGELEAASAIGMSTLLRLRRIVVPQVVKIAIPGMGNVWQLTLKDSALVSVTGVAELMRMSQIAAGSTRRYFLFFIVGGVLYLTLTSASDFLFNRAERHANKSMGSGAMGRA